MTDPGNVFIAKSREYLTESYLPKIERALDGISEDELWHRPNQVSNSLANLLLHLAGSTRYWIASVAGGAANDRVRDQEFAARSGFSRQELIEGLRRAVTEADTVLAQMTSAQLLEMRQHIKGPVTVLDAVYHGVEHFSMHTGQILQLVKILKSVDLELTR